MDCPPARDGAAARMACQLRERGHSADLRERDPRPVLTACHPAAPFGGLCQQTAATGTAGERSRRAR
jgi:hypothetical protein